MASKKEVLKIVAERFPESNNQIINLFPKSEFFRSICEDYVNCLQTMDRLESSKQMKKIGFKREYESLLQELEDELMSNLRQTE